VQSKDPKKNAMDSIPSSTIEDFDGDMTLDLAEPYSHSGRYWKSEYDRYHEEAIAEMKRLVKHKQLVKSYAKKKDSEAIELGEKLKEEQQKVANMEAKISELVAQIANRRLSGRENENHDQSNRRGQRHTSASIAQTPSETGPELNRAKEQLAEMGSLRDEMHSLRLNLSMAEKKVSRLQDENAKLAKDLAKVSEELDKSEKRRQSSEAQNHERALLLETIERDYDTLKELAKSQRGDAEGLLKKRHDQVVKLKKEIKSFKEKGTASTRETSNQGTSHTHSKMSTHTKEEVAEAGRPKRITQMEEDLMSFDTPPKPERRSIGSHGKVDNDLPHQRARETVGVLLPRSSTSTRHDDNIRTKTDERENNHLLDSKIPTLSRAKEKFESVQQEDAKADGSVPRHSNVASKHTALSEIINDSKVDHLSVRNQSSPASQLSASFQERFSSLSLNSPGSALPSPEPSFALAPSRRIRDKRGTDSPRPSMFNIRSSPPRQVVPRPRSSGIDARERHNGNAASGRMSSMSSRARVALSSDRAAAAKARLEQKSAEKRRAQEGAEDKENIRT
jgi:myosin heavy subunit